MRSTPLAPGPPGLVSSEPFAVPVAWWRTTESVISFYEQADYDMAAQTQSTMSGVQP